MVATSLTRALTFGPHFVYWCVVGFSHVKYVPRFNKKKKKMERLPAKIHFKEQRTKTKSPFMSLESSSLLVPLKSIAIRNLRHTCIEKDKTSKCVNIEK